MSDLETELRSAMAGEVRADAYTRHLFSSDASMYSIEPLAVVFPAMQPMSPQPPGSARVARFPCCREGRAPAWPVRRWDAR